MPQILKILLLMTDIGFLLYWGVTALMTCGFIALPADWLFKDYRDPNIIAWNWSFMPLDLLASVTGLRAVSRAARGKVWRNAAMISLTLTFCAGFMAISFWSVQRSFDAAWWGPNLFLTLWPLIMLPSVARQP
jgi:Family of unknown function (DUF5360)